MFSYFTLFCLLFHLAGPLSEDKELLASALEMKGEDLSLSAEESYQYISKAYQLRKEMGKYNLVRMKTAALLQNIAMELGKFDEAAILQKEVIDVSKLVYPPNHPMTGLQLYTLGDLLCIDFTSFAFRCPL